MRSIRTAAPDAGEDIAAEVKAADFFECLPFRRQIPSTKQSSYPSLSRRPSAPALSPTLPSAHYPPAVLTAAAAWRGPAERSAGNSLSDRQVSEWRTHPARAESIAARSAEVTLTAPAAERNSRSCRPASTAPVTSESPDTGPTARAVDGHDELSCLEKSGRPLARRIFFPEAEAARLALGPGLPHHRHALTPDEALAGIIMATICAAALVYAIARWLS